MWARAALAAFGLIAIVVFCGCLPIDLASASATNDVGEIGETVPLEYIPVPDGAIAFPRPWRVPAFVFGAVLIGGLSGWGIHIAARASDSIRGDTLIFAAGVCAALALCGGWGYLLFNILG